MNPLSQLGSRLNAILELVRQVQKHNPYMCIWDCCCDHGYLGTKILIDDLCDKLVFVDQVPHIIETLRDRLAPFSTGNHELIVADVGALKFDAQRHLLILAGVGGENTVQIIKSIECNNPDVLIDYIFCPSTSQKTLRQYLYDENFGFLEERIVCEKERCYEIIFVQGSSRKNNSARVPLSCNCWDENDSVQQKYLNKAKRSQSYKN